MGNTTYLTPGNGSSPSYQEMEELQEDLPPVLTLATFRRSGFCAWEIRPGLTLFCSAVSGTQKPRWWLSMMEALTGRHDETGFACTPELDRVEVPEILKAIQLRSLS